MFLQISVEGVIIAPAPISEAQQLQLCAGQTCTKACTLQPTDTEGFLEQAPFPLCVLGLLWKGHLVPYQHRPNPLPVMYVFILKLNILMYYLFLKCHGLDSELSPPGRPLKPEE